MKPTQATYTNLQLRELRTYLWGLKLNPAGLSAAGLRSAQRELKAVKSRSATLPPWRIRNEPGLSYDGKWHYALAHSNCHIIALIKRLTEDRSEPESLKIK